MEGGGQIRHEYLDGLLFPALDESRWHHLLVGNLLRHVSQCRSSHGCRVFALEVKIRVPTDNCFYYPDVVKL